MPCEKDTYQNMDYHILSGCTSCNGIISIYFLKGCSHSATATVFSYLSSQMDFIVTNGFVRTATSCNLVFFRFVYQKFTEDPFKKLTLMLPLSLDA